MGVILLLSSRSSLSSDLPADQLLVSWVGQYQSEVGHLVEYAILGMLAWLVVAPVSNGRVAFMLCVTFCVVFAMADEVFQSTIPNRTPELVDLIADTAGAIVGIGILRAWGPWLSDIFTMRRLPNWPKPQDTMQGARCPSKKV